LRTGIAARTYWALPIDPKLYRVRVRAGCDHPSVPRLRDVADEDHEVGSQLGVEHSLRSAHLVLGRARRQPESRDVEAGDLVVPNAGEGPDVPLRGELGHVMRQRRF
jgi:hypothetical protein